MTDITLGAERLALDYIAWGALLIALGAVLQAVLASIAAMGRKDPFRGWVRVAGWGLIMCGTVMNAYGAGILASWWR